MKSMKLHAHQLDAVRYLRAEEPGDPHWRVVSMPTGAGKTDALSAALATEPRRWRHAIVLTPYVHSEAGFAKPLDYAERDDFATVEMPDSFWRVVRADAPKGAASLLAYLAEPNPGCALLTTHAQARGWVHLLPADCTCVLLVVDECHHMGENETQIHALGETLHKRGGQLWQATATLYRDSGAAIFPAHVVPFQVHYSRLAAAGLAPARLELDLLAADIPGRDVADSDIDRLVHYISSQRTAKGKLRPTIVNIPAGASEEPDTRAVLLAARFVEAFERIGIKGDRVFNAVGPDRGPALRDRLDTEREAGRGPGFNARTLDVIVSCQRMLEAADWPACSHVVTLGVPASTVKVAQSFGRALRRKDCIKGYPAKWRDEARFTMFVHNLATDDEAARLDQVKRILVISCMIEGVNALTDIHRRWRYLVEGLRLPASVRHGGGPTAAEDEEGVAEEDRYPGVEDIFALAGIDEEAVREALTRLGAVHEHLHTTLGREPTAGEVRDFLSHGDDDVLTQLSDELLLASSPELQERLRDVLRAQREAVGDGTSSDGTSGDGRRTPGDLPDIFRDALARLAAEPEFSALVSPFRPLHPRRPLYPRFTGWSTVLTPADLQRITQRVLRVRAACWARFTDAHIVRAVFIPFAQDHAGRRPAMRLDADADASNYVGVRMSMRDLDGHLRATGFSVDQLAACPPAWVLGPDYDRDAVQHAVGHFSASGGLSIRHLVPSAQIIRHAVAQRAWVYRSWHLYALELAARRGWRGFVGGQSLSEALAEGAGS